MVHVRFDLGGSAAELPDGRLAFATYSDMHAAIATATLTGALTQTVIVNGPVVGASISGVDRSGRVLVHVGLHHYP